jgi:type IV pilus assembly protein PilB
MVDINRAIFYLNREQEERHTQELAKKLNIAYINLSNYPIAPDILALIPKEIALQYQLIPYLKIGSEVKIGVANPGDKNVKRYLDKLSAETTLKFSIVLISRSSLFYGILAYEKGEKEEQEKKDVAVKEKEETFEEEIKDMASAAMAAKKVTATRLLDVIMTGAVKTKASDVHIEPSENDFLIRYRIDGVLQDVVRLPKNQYRLLLSRIKFLAKLRMDESSEPQDGRFSIKSASGMIDLRVSILPSAGGESIVIRLLGQEKEMLRLDKLGFRPDALSVMRAAISRPHGMILTSGPTGSGKSSTLYAILMELNKTNVKIITLEDPVEYKIDGVEQSQVKKDEGYTFAAGLRASLRQDPDIIMVGEVRDAETAEIAVQAALTGHLMLSTIHANSAPGVFVRLLDVGVKPFLLSGSINLVMAQRLVRKICQFCVEEYEPRPEVWQEIQKTLEPLKGTLDQNMQTLLSSSQPKLKRGKGCPRCASSGFSGREVIIEVLVPNEEIEDLISKKASISEFARVAQASGMVSMEQDGLTRVLQGSTVVEEVWRVTKE